MSDGEDTLSSPDTISVGEECSEVGDSEDECSEGPYIPMYKEPFPTCEHELPAAAVSRRSADVPAEDEDEDEDAGEDEVDAKTACDEKCVVCWGLGEAAEHEAEAAFDDLLSSYPDVLPGQGFSYDSLVIMGDTDPGDYGSPTTGEEHGGDAEEAVEEEEGEYDLWPSSPDVLPSEGPSEDVLPMWKKFFPCSSDALPGQGPGEDVLRTDTGENVLAEVMFFGGPREDDADVPAKAEDKDKDDTAEAAEKADYDDLRSSSPDVFPGRFPYNFHDDDEVMRICPTCLEQYTDDQSHFSTSPQCEPPATYERPFDLSLMEKLVFVCTSGRARRGGECENGTADDDKAKKKEDEEAQTEPSDEEAMAEPSSACRTSKELLMHIEEQIGWQFDDDQIAICAATTKTMAVNDRNHLVVDSEVVQKMSPAQRELHEEQLWHLMKKGDDVTGEPGRNPEKLAEKMRLLVQQKKVDPGVFFKPWWLKEVKPSMNKYRADRKKKSKRKARDYGVEGAGSSSRVCCDSATPAAAPAAQGPTDKRQK